MEVVVAPRCCAYHYYWPTVSSWKWHSCHFSDPTTKSPTDDEASIRLSPVERAWASCLLLSKYINSWLVRWVQNFDKK